ncbi:alpha/beta hydrolase family protein [Rhizoctonia solani]|uniref:Alpha/beta hydrolase family protein n=1 Tax=Rhizoctonia solani TaxID=456999 RepID=A0A8H8NPN6_9AGAM|nr:alpha/beta hydrolase family protein [Rhizoctonia solani]QRW16413.1 alpha/beta hydrolase family protein [Rhizoctonia solani]
MNNFREFTWETRSGATVYCKYRSSSNPDAARRPILLLLHGYPQNHLMWNEFVKGLPDDFHLVVPDLPGYGQSIKKPSPDGSHRSHSKKEWSQDIIETIQQIPTPRDGNSTPKIIAFGHDRGARLSYRMALEAPGTVVGIAVLDIVPTPFMWSRMSLGESRHDETKKSHHWVFLASPAPLPETLISAQADFYYTYTIKSWTGSSALAIIDKTNTIAGWQKDSIAPFLTNDEAAHRRITAACEDYRAGSTVDIEDDLASGIDPATFERNKQDSVITEPRIPVFSVPVLVLSSTHLRRRFPVDEIWGSLCARDGLTCAQVGDEGTGHFFVNEATEETLGASVPWLSQFK